MRGFALDYERKSRRTWTVAEAKARLSEVLRRAEDEGPQRIGTRKAFVVVPARIWEERNEHQPSLGQWLLTAAPRIGRLELPPREDGPRQEDPFAGWTQADWEALDRSAGRDADE